MRLAFVLAIVACSQGELSAPPPPPAPSPRVAPTAAPEPTPPPSAPPRRPHTVQTDKLGTTEPLPAHGVVLHTWGLAGDSILTLDADTSKLHSVSNLMGAKPRETTRKLSAAQVAKLVEVANAAWIEEPTGPGPFLTDIREDLIVVDGSEAFYVTGSPLGADEEQKGRPAAGRAVAALVAALR